MSDWDVGVARARVRRLMDEIARERHVSPSVVESAVLASETHRRLGSPGLGYTDERQTAALERMLEGWLEQARATRPKAPRRCGSKAPPAPWQRGRQGRTTDRG